MESFDDNDPLSLEQVFHRVQFDPHPKVSDGLSGLHGGSPNIMVADQFKFKRDPLCEKNQWPCTPEFWNIQFRPVRVLTRVLLNKYRLW